MEDWNRNKMIRINLKDIFFFFHLFKKLLKNRLKEKNIYFSFAIFDFISFCVYAHFSLVKFGLNFKKLRIDKTQQRGFEETAKLTKVRTSRKRHEFKGRIKKHTHTHIRKCKKKNLEKKLETKTKTY